MEYARRRCGRSCLGPGFESPRLHSVTPYERKRRLYEAPFTVYEPSFPTQLSRRKPLCATSALQQYSSSRNRAISLTISIVCASSYEKRASSESRSSHFQRCV